MDKLLSATLKDVVQLCEADNYDYIVVGSGMGGGMLARTLLDRTEENENAPRVLLIERGGLLFSTHCMNTSCPHWAHQIPEGPSMDNALVYETVKDHVSTVTSKSHEYAGGPVHCLGGRSNVWGLYTPVIDSKQVEEYFPSEIRSYLFDEGGYSTAYKLMSNDPEASLDRPYPQNGTMSTTSIDNIIAKLNRISSSQNSSYADAKGFSCSPFACCPNAVEFTPKHPDQDLYQIPMGGFSTVNWILDRAYNKDERLTVLPHTQVMTVNSTAADDGSKVVSLTARDRLGKERRIPIGNATVILSSGAIDTAAIALRSGMGKDQILVGKGLTDHDIWGTRLEFLEGKEVQGLSEQSLRLQSCVKFPGCNDSVLLNVTINASSFLGRTQENNFPAIHFDEKGNFLSADAFTRRLNEYDMKKSTIQVVYEFCAPLSDNNKVLNLPEPTPTIQIEHEEDNSGFILNMQNLALAIKQELGPYSQSQVQCCVDPRSCCYSYTGALATCSCGGQGFRAQKAKGDSSKRGGNIREHTCECPAVNQGRSPLLPRLYKAPFGVVAHEVGTMRMGLKKACSVVDENLQVHGWSNLFVCDLSVFPVSPSANPSLTLAALAQRLGMYLKEQNA